MKLISSCRLACPDVCSLLVEKKADGTIKIRGNPDHPFTRGFTCGKVHRFLRHLSSPHRVTRPMLQEQGGWREISWDRALDLCAAKIQALRSEPEAILHITGDGAKGAGKISSSSCCIRAWPIKRLSQNASTPAVRHSGESRNPELSGSSGPRLAPG